MRDVREVDRFRPQGSGHVDRLVEVHVARMRPIFPPKRAEDQDVDTFHRSNRFGRDALAVREIGQAFPLRLKQVACNGLIAMGDWDHLNRQIAKPQLREVRKQRKPKMRSVQPRLGPKQCVPEDSSKI